MTVSSFRNVETEDEIFGEEDGDGEDEGEVEVDEGLEGEGDGDDENWEGGAEYNRTSEFEDTHHQVERHDMGNEGDGEGEGEGMVGESFSSSEDEEEEEEEEIYGNEQPTDVYQAY